MTSKALVWLKDLVTRHVGGIPRSWEDLKWVYLVNPTIPPTVVPSTEVRPVAPHNQPLPPPANQLPSGTKVMGRESGIAYHLRDVRRAYPQTVVYGATELAHMRIAALPAGDVAASTALYVVVCLIRIWTRFSYIMLTPSNTTHPDML
jgi:hypothetical protein